MLQRSTLHKLIQDDDRVKYSITITGDECPYEGVLSHQRQMELIRLIADMPGLALVGPGPFQTMSMTHNGQAWVIRLEAIYEAASGDKNGTA